MAIEWLGSQGFEKVSLEQKQKEENSLAKKFKSEKSAFTVINTPIIAPIAGNNCINLNNSYNNAIRKSSFKKLNKKTTNNNSMSINKISNSSNNHSDVDLQPFVILKSVLKLFEGIKFPKDSENLRNDEINIREISNNISD